jgi:hypothetical protein
MRLTKDYLDGLAAATLEDEDVRYAIAASARHVVKKEFEKLAHAHNHYREP